MTSTASKWEHQQARTGPRSNPTPAPNRRVLIVDDNQAIQEDFRRVLGNTTSSSTLEDIETELFGTTSRQPDTPLELDFASQGQEALGKVEVAVAAGQPYALAFVDVRMPPGWDGLETSLRILQADPLICVVICSAYSDHLWDDMAQEFGNTDRVLFLKKPFDIIEVRQLANALVRRWELAERASMRVDELEHRVAIRTHELTDANEQLRREAAARERMEIELRLAQKLEAVGQLAAGIAHEINTPIQYVGDNLQFLKNAFEDYTNLLQNCQDMLGQAGSQFTEELQLASEDADLDYLQEHIPRAFTSLFDGVNSVSAIVRSMKEFSHPDQREQAPVDINRAMQNTLIVARNEYKYVAEVEVDFGTVPNVLCHGGDINQVFLNLIVNASHAIADAVTEENPRGKIYISTRQEDDQVLIQIRDTGTGIPAELRQRVFDPFFTTKAVGKGTGQGLAIAHTVVDKHGGTLSLESQEGQGTTFFIRLPIQGVTGDSSAPG